MTKSKNIPDIFRYGVQITKPWNQDMATHNDKITELMKSNIRSAWKAELTKLEDSDRYYLEREWNEDDLKAEFPNIVKLQRGVCYSGYGGGYTIGDVCKEFETELDMMAPYQLDQEYPYMVKEGLVPEVGMGLVGYESKEQINDLRSYWKLKDATK